MTPKASKAVMIPLTQIENRFDVRTKLNEDRVLQLVGCYEAGVDLPPVTLVPIGEDKYAYVDGRHRGAARGYLNCTDVASIIIPRPDDPAELFARALQANWGGSQPPTRDDISHTILRMLELKASQTAIREQLFFLPTGSLKAYIAQARGVIMKRRILDAIGDGVKIEEAASRFGIPLDSMKDIIQGKKGKWGKGRSSEVDLSVAMKAYISTSLRSANAGISKKVEGILAKVEAGEMSHKVAADILKAWSEHLRKTSLRVADWHSRLGAIGGATERSADAARDQAAA